jgi:hypothetical protein
VNLARCKFGSDGLREPVGRKTRRAPDIVFQAELHRAGLSRAARVTVPRNVEIVVKRAPEGAPGRFLNAT